MAESWSASPDGLTLTFKLRSDLKFPDGTPATAEDAAWSIQRAVLLGFFSSSNLTQWGFNKDQITDQIQAPDATTLVLKLSKPYPVPLLLSAAFANNSVSVILSKAAGLKNAKTADGKSDLGNAFFKTGPVCVGPYHVTRWNANDVVILERNDDLFRRQAKPQAHHHPPRAGISARTAAAGKGRYRRSPPVEHRRSEGAGVQQGHPYRADADAGLATISP